jgi:uncharacterized protein (DUF1778 family)
MKDRRREVRLSSLEDDLIVEAAGLAGVSVSEFLLDRAISEAQDAVEAHHAIRLDVTAQRRFLAALDRPTTPPKELIEQIRKARPLKHVD